MSETTMLVTGATDGIGRQTAAQLAKRGARVLVHGRSEAKATATCAQLSREVPGATFVPVWGDLSSFEQVRALAAQVVKAAPVLDVLVNNAGLFAKERTVSADGLELTTAVNHLAPFLLTHLLLDGLKAAPQGRVVNVSSVAHSRGEVDVEDLGFEKGFTGYGAYAASKLMNIYFTHELARRLKGTRVTVSALHPGVIGTKLLRAGFGSMAAADVEEGARTSVFCATEPALAQVSGRYYSDGAEARCAAHAVDPVKERALYEKSAALTGVTPLPVP